MAPKDREDFVLRLNTRLQEEHKEKQNMFEGIHKSLSALFGSRGKS